MTRAFVAVKLPEEAIRALVARTGGLEIPGGRTMTAEQLHLTLQFLGNDADIVAVAAALGGFAVPGGRVRLGGAGAFPSARHARVLWVGVTQGHDVLARLAAEVAERMASVGYEPEARSFLPHVTVARCAKPTDLRAAITALDSGPLGRGWKVERLAVVESQLGGDGSRYVDRAWVPLPG